MRKLKFLAIAALWVFQADVFAQDNGEGPSAENGKNIYEQSCFACHQADGSGVPGLAPPLIKGTFVNGDKLKLISIILQGMEGVEINGEYYANPMPAFDYLSDQDIADVLTFVRTNFKNEAPPITSNEVKMAREKKK